MAKIVGYEVTARKPVCVDFPDGRVVSFRPGTRFEAHPTNSSVRRLLRIREVRQLGPREGVPALPVKLGAPKQVRDILEARKKLARAKHLSQQKLRASRKRGAAVEAVDLGALNRPAPSGDAPLDDN